ncbi:MAG: hypothetical protein JJU28_24485 [Cyclobacteriaceae bacterium]|nr:hypothetical protein [Cyclobacteriaceae bacterium]
MRKEITEIEINCLAQLAIDFMPLHDIVREFSGFNDQPTENEFLLAIEFLEYFINFYHLKYLKGPEMIEMEISVKELVENLKKSWYSGQYEEINYSVWLQKPASANF